MKLRFSLLLNANGGQTIPYANIIQVLKGTDAGKTKEFFDTEVFP
jgi:hypothetical protein